MNRVLQVGSFFDGERYVDGPYRIEIAAGRYREISRGVAPDATEQYDFIMPALTECHSHLFLDGDELDPARRKAYLAGNPDSMFANAQRQLRRCVAAGITTVRDAGDAWGVNLRLRERANRQGVTVIAAGRAVRKSGRYGSFMAGEIADATAIPGCVAEIARHADMLKILQTGIIDFANGTVKGEPQFTPAELRLLVECARDHGLKTFVHCSGPAGLAMAIEAGADFIEHGFFMTPELLERMADRSIAWTPTFLPVAFQAREPQHAGWTPETVTRLRRLLEHHAAMVRQALALGVAILAGSDAGSCGVGHGDGLWKELHLLQEAGLSEEQTLAAATSVPQRQFGLPGGRIRPGDPADFITCHPLQAEVAPARGFESICFR